MAKIRFFAAYAVSVLLFVVLFSSFLAPDDDVPETKIASSNGTTDRHAAICRLLHMRMGKLDDISTEVVESKSAASLALLRYEEAAFFTGLDSIRKTVALAPDAEKERDLAVLLESFGRAAQKQVGLARSVALSGEGSTRSQATSDQLALKEQRIQELESENRLLLLEKEEAVSALQNMPSTPTRLPQRAADGGQWKEKYEALKSANDKLKESSDRYASQAEELKKSYKDVVEDNRRLLAQLQAARAGKN